MSDFTPYKMSDKDLAAGKWRGIPAFLAESQLLIEKAYETGLEVLSMLSTEDFPFPDIPCDQKLVVSPEEYEAITGYPQTRSIVGICARPQEPSLDKVLDKSSRVIIVEDSTNGANMATIFRIARTFGIDAVLISCKCADPLFRRSARMSKGAVLDIPWLRIGTTRAWAQEVVPQLHDAGFQLAALALEEDSISLDELPKVDKLALVMGTEGEGLQQATIELCDYTVIIPMRDGIDSLNVAAATAVACWQATRP